MRRQYSYLLVAFLLFGAILLSATAGRAASVSVRVDSVEAASGRPVQIPVTVQGAPGIGAMHLEIRYDAAILEAQAADKGVLLGDNALLDFNVAEPGKLVIGLVTLDAIEGDGTLLTTRFMVKGKEGQSSPLRLENAKAWGGKTRLDILVNTEDGKFTVGPAELSLASPLMVVALLCALLLLFLFLVLLLLLRRRRRRPPPAAVHHAPPSQPTAPPPSQTAPPPPQHPSGGPNFCPHCGTPREAGNRFCTNCGQRVAD
jgi:hypothetical protein